MLPVPEAVHELPTELTHVHWTPATADGNVSVTTAPLTACGPRLVAVTVYVTVDPAGADVTPSVFVIARSDDETSVVAVAVLLPGAGSVVVNEPAVAVFEMTVPPTTPAPTLTARANTLALAGARDAFVQSTVPFVPTAGV